MRQRLGKKKHALCEKIGGKRYFNCYVRGGEPHFSALCWYSKCDADRVNYKTGEWRPSIRDGKMVDIEPTGIEKAVKGFLELKRNG